MNKEETTEEAREEREAKKRRRQGREEGWSRGMGKKSPSFLVQEERGTYTKYRRVGGSSAEETN